MPKFMLAYHGGNKPSSKEEGMAQMQKWQSWIQGLGSKVVNPGTPLPNSAVVNASGVQEGDVVNPMSGFAVVEVENIEAAIEIAKTDPFLDMKGDIRVAEMMELKG